jgi:hypothetical protein
MIKYERPIVKKKWNNSLMVSADVTAPLPHYAINPLTDKVL